MPLLHALSMGCRLPLTWMDVGLVFMKRGQGKWFGH